MKYSLCLLLLFFMACEPTKKESSSSIETPEPTFQQPAHHIESLTKIFEAHGGYEQWKKMKSLTYVRGEETTITNLRNRHIRLESSERTIGFDGKQVWVTPNTADPSRARFYHNLYFYFYAMPFVVGDQGAFYEEMPQRELADKMYNGVKVSYNEGVGDASEDNYIIWSDPETNRMEWLMYTVTYNSGESSDKFSLIRYTDWNELNGLTLPTKLQWYGFENDKVGGVRKESGFSSIVIGSEAPEESVFEMPEGALIAEK